MNKKVSNSQQRLVELMDYYHLNQTELCKRTGLQKSALSNYLKGDREPRQDQISLIADPFNINPAWLMGYDVSMFMPEDTPEAQNDRDFWDRNSTGAGAKAIELYDAYQNAPADIRSAIDTLLKSSQSKP